MIVDTSVLVAIFADEPEHTRFTLALAVNDSNQVSAGTWIEFGTVLARRYRLADPDSVQTRLAEWLRLSITPVDEHQARAASLGYAAFGRATGHRADLNFGDCFSYALAKTSGEPLLFEGDDFNHTDLLLAPESAYPR